jgi:hypothetical protein
MAAKHIIDEHDQGQAAQGCRTACASGLCTMRSSSQRESNRGPLDPVKKLAAAEASAAWGECFFECNFPFRAADNQRFKKAMKLSIAPGCKKVAGTLLTNCHSKYQPMVHFKADEDLTWEQLTNKKVRSEKGDPLRTAVRWWVAAGFSPTLD